jgi:hypothetical protein
VARVAGVMRGARLGAHAELDGKRRLFGACLLLDILWDLCTRACQSDA